MNNKTDFIRISIFTSKENWNIVLQKCIKSFLAIKSIKECVKTYNISFNNKRGDNIRISILVSVTELERVANRADSYFKNFLINSNLTKLDMPPGKDDIFLPFPVNTVQYGLYLEKGIESKYYFPELKENLSQIIVNTLSNEIVDDETIFSFSLYLHLILTNVLKKTIKEFNPIFYHYCENFMTQEKNDPLKDDAETYFIGNSQVILEIYEDVINSLHKRQVSWMSTWQNICKKEVLNLAKNLDLKQDILSIYQILFDSINNQIGISKFSQNLLIYTIKRLEISAS
jgi:hypothetical protein